MVFQVRHNKLLLLYHRQANNYTEINPLFKYGHPDDAHLFFTSFFDKLENITEVLDIVIATA